MVSTNVCSCWPNTQTRIYSQDCFPDKHAAAHLNLPALSAVLHGSPGEGDTCREPVLLLRRRDAVPPPPDTCNTQTQGDRVRDATFFKLPLGNCTLQHNTRLQSCYPGLL